MSKLVPVPLSEVEKLLLDSGLLYAINKLVLHPVGMALSLNYGDDASDSIFEIALLKTDDGDYMEFSPDMIEECTQKLGKFLSARVRSRMDVCTLEESDSMATLFEVARIPEVKNNPALLTEVFSK